MRKDSGHQEDDDSYDDDDAVVDKDGFGEDGKFRAGRDTRTRLGFSLG